MAGTTLRSPVDSCPQNHLLSSPGPPHLSLPEAGDEGWRLLAWAGLGAGLGFFLFPFTNSVSQVHT